MPPEPVGQVRSRRMASLSRYRPGAHPRRPPAHKSVSLVHSPRRQSHAPNHECGPSESSSAESWFDKSNNNVTRDSAPFVDSKQ